MQTERMQSSMDATPVIRLIGAFTYAGRSIAPALAGLGFVISALQLLIAHVIGSSRGQELGKAGMIGSVVGLVAVFFAPQIMATVHAAFGS
jgi:hypothetical protein